jgi:hypothetical protein
VAGAAVSLKVQQSVALTTVVAHHHHGSLLPLPHFKGSLVLSVQRQQAEPLTTRKVSWTLVLLLLRRLQ